MKKYIILALALVAMAGCAKDETLGGSGDESTLVQFSSSSLGSKLNASGTEWISGDTVGIYMYDETLGLYTYSNVPYVAVRSASTTSFTAVNAGEAIQYLNGNDVSFRAYFPYSELASEDNIAVDLNDQSTTSPGEIALMLSDVVDVDWDKANSSSSTKVAFDFDHQLSRVVFTFTPKESIKDIDTELTAVYIDAPATATYTLDGTLSSMGDSHNISMYSESGTVYSAVMLPQTSATSYDVTIVLGDYSAKLTLNETFGAGLQYNYAITVGLDVAEFTGESSITPFQTATVVDSDLQTDDLTGTKYISSVADLKKIGNEWSMDGDYELLSSLDLEGETWTPIGSDTDNAFSGSFNGNGFTISNFKLDMITEYQGFFGTLDDGAEVKNLNVECEMFMSIYPSDLELFDRVVVKFVGGIAGCNYGTISNCSVSVESFSCIDAPANGDLLISSWGGITGINYSLVTDCYNKTVSMTLNANMGSVGGIVGENSGTVQNSYNLSLTYSPQSGSYEYAFVGGVVGNNFSNIYNCYNQGAIFLYLDNAYCVGGIVGQTYEDSSVSGGTNVVNCYNFGNVGSMGSGSNNTGGICGYINGADSKDGNNFLVNCYNAGIVFGWNNTGGIVGNVTWTDDDYLTNYMYSCYNIGYVWGYGIGYGIGYGAFSGCEIDNNYTDVNNCYILSDATNSVTQTDVTLIAANELNSLDVIEDLDRGAAWCNRYMNSDVACTWMLGTGSGTTVDDYAYPMLNFGTVAVEDFN